MPYIFRDCDRVLFREAILLGDRLASMPEATPQIVEKIRLFQNVLARLPEVPKIWFGELAFGVMNLAPDFSGVNRSWYVYFEAKIDRSLTVGNIFTTLHNGTQCAEEQDHDEEDWFMFYPDKECDFDPRRYRAWLRAVRKPDQFRNSRQEFEVEAAYDTQFPGWARKRRRSGD